MDSLAAECIATQHEYDDEQGQPDFVCWKAHAMLSDPGEPSEFRWVMNEQSILAPHSARAKLERACMEMVADLDKAEAPTEEERDELPLLLPLPPTPPYPYPYPYTYTDPYPYPYPYPYTYPYLYLYTYPYTYPYTCPCQERDEQMLRRGVTLKTLRRIRNGLREERMPTWKVVRDFIRPTTRGSRCRWVDTVHASEVGRATPYPYPFPYPYSYPYPRWGGPVCSSVTGETTVPFIPAPFPAPFPAPSLHHHCSWGAPFEDLVAAVDHALDSDESVYVWLDILAVRQWAGNVADLAFEPVVRGTQALLLVSPHLESVARIDRMDALHCRVPIPEEALKNCAFFRIWCLVELVEALRRGKAVVMLIGRARADGSFEPNRDMGVNLLQMVDIQHATATVPEDLRREMARIKATVGVAAVNSLAKGAIGGSLSGMMHNRQILAAACGAGQGITVALPRHRWDEALACAAMAGFNGPVAELVAAKADVEARSDGCTHLLTAAGGAHYTVVNTLIEAKASLEARESRSDNTALMTAAMGGHATMAHVLMEARADVNARRRDGTTALMVATCGQCSEVIHVLLGAKADPNTGQFPLGGPAAPAFMAAMKTPLGSAAMEANVEITHDPNPNPSSTVFIFQ